MRLKKELTKVKSAEKCSLLGQELEQRQMLSISLSGLYCPPENSHTCHRRGGQRFHSNFNQSMTDISYVFQAHMIPPDTLPLLVFVNVRSGGGQGQQLINQFRKLLNPHQVFNLENGGPLAG